ncbi:structural maintenance of chromosomes 5 smc5, partial [Hortaea werneckii]
VIRRKYTREGNKTDFYLNGRKTSQKEILKLLKGFSIQVQNLCQFLPQDRVVEFAALNPEALLVQTQQAAAPAYMHDWYEELKGMQKEYKSQKSEEQSLLERLKHLEQRQNLSAPDVQRLRERDAFKERIESLQQLRPFAEYQLARKRTTEAKQRQKAAERELRRLRDQIEPNLAIEKEKETYLFEVDKVSKSRMSLLEKMAKTVAAASQKFTAADEAIESSKKKLENEQKSLKATKQKMPGLHQNLTAIQNALNAGAPEPVDQAALNEENRRLIIQRRDIESEISSLLEERGSLEQRITVQRQEIQKAEQERERSQTQAGQLSNKLKRINPAAHRAWEWIESNRHRFRSEVYGPPVIECSIHDPRHAAAVEYALGGDALAFTVTSSEDFKMLGHELYAVRGISVSIRAVHHPASAFMERIPLPQQQLRQSYGLQHYITDLIEGPDAVISMLCDNRNIHQQAYTSEKLSVGQVNALKQADSPIASWITANETYQITRRKEYGDKASSTRMARLRDAKLFADSSTTTVQQPEDEDLNQRITTAEREIADLQTRHTDLGTRHNTLKSNREEIESNMHDIQQRKSAAQRQQAAWQALPEKQRDAETKIADAQRRLRASADAQFRIMTEGDEAVLRKGQLALDYANQVSSLRDLHRPALEASIVSIEARSDFESIQERNAEDRERLVQREQEVRELTEEKNRQRAKGDALGSECARVSQVWSEETAELYQRETKEWEPDRLETEIQSVQARLEMAAGDGTAGGQRVIAEFERRAREITEGYDRKAVVDESLKDLEENITEVRGRWEPELHGVIARISEAFADNFARIHCAGEVGIYKDPDDFERWAVQIKVKFREHEQLSILDSHRQSGGERAVSTIFYLMALQSLARSPFRVVDEINQGMDPRNERLVHSRIVEIACGQGPHNTSSNDGELLSAAANGGGGSQYFLITPKLLPGLRYEEGMRVHCIASGEFMPKEIGSAGDDDQEGGGVTDGPTLDFAALARRALAASDLSSTYNSQPWQQKISQQVSDALRERKDWIGIDWASSSEGEGKREVKLLDYASGTGNITQALLPYVTTVKGIDLSEKMVEEYNRAASTSGIPPEQALSVVGDLCSASTDIPDHFRKPEWYSFDLAVIGLGFHHFEDPGLAVQRLSERLRKGGVLVIVDFLPFGSEERDMGEMAKTIKHDGFTREGMERLFGDGGMGVVKFDVVGDVTMELKKGTVVRKMFVARAEKL